MENVVKNEAANSNMVGEEGNTARPLPHSTHEVSKYNQATSAELNPLPLGEQCRVCYLIVLSRLSRLIC